MTLLYHSISFFTSKPLCIPRPTTFINLNQTSMPNYSNKNCLSLIRTPHLWSHSFFYRVWLAMNEQTFICTTSISVHRRLFKSSTSPIYLHLPSIHGIELRSIINCSNLFFLLKIENFSLFLRIVNLTWNLKTITYLGIFNTYI